MDNRMTSVEIQAVTVEDAVRLALEQLDLPVEEVDIEILAEASDDDEALVRVTAKGMASQPTPRGGSRGGGGDRGRGPRTPGARRVPGDRPSSRGVPPRTERPPMEPHEETEDDRIAIEVVADLLARLGVVAEVVATGNPSVMPEDGDEPPTVFVDILGQDLGMLIGRRGEHLSHLQYLVNLLAGKRLEGYTRIVVDVEGYRTRREESLIGLAERVARQVARSGRSMQLEPMPPNERRIIHLSLRENPEVTTESSGEGNLRRVTILPA